MIRSTQTSLKFSNTHKLNKVIKLIDEYKNVIKQFIDILWDKENIPKLLPKEITCQVQTCLSARMIQCIGKQASGIVRGTKQKQKQRLWQINKFTEEGKHRKAKKLQKLYNKVKTSKPNIDKVEPELDSRFVNIDLDNRTSFDGWLTITSIGNKEKIVLPFKKSKHFNKLLKNGIIKKGVRLSNKTITLTFDIVKPIMKKSGETVGIDIGQVAVLSVSNGYTSKKDKHGHDLTSITNRLSRRRKGSNSFKRTVEHRKNHIHWSINQLNLSKVKQVNIENIKYLRRGRKYSRQLSHWTYANIFDKLENYCHEQGVLVYKVNSAYTSQRCSKCGWVCKSNRKRKLFKCVKCGFTFDSDLNASRNIALSSLPKISKRKRSLHLNRTGFYWNEVSQ